MSYIHKRLLARVAVMFSGLLFISNCAEANNTSQTQYDELVHVMTEDAERFAKVFLDADGQPASEMLQKAYLDPGSEGVAIFTPGRIENAQHMADMIGQYNEYYTQAVDVCVPQLADVSDALVSKVKEIWAMADAKHPITLYVLFGAMNSGGTAGENAFVLGLEVLCRNNETFETELVTMAAHETVHVLQKYPAEPQLLSQSLIEGTADFIAAKVMGGLTSQGLRTREAYGRENENVLWAEFVSDIESNCIECWLYNGGQGSDRPADMGYWIGMQIADAYFQQADDKSQALQDLLGARDARDILAISQYGDNKLQNM